MTQRQVAVWRFGNRTTNIAERAILQLTCSADPYVQPRLMSKDHSSGPGAKIRPCATLAVCEKNHFACVFSVLVRRHPCARYDCRTAGARRPREESSPYRVGEGSKFTNVLECRSGADSYQLCPRNRRIHKRPAAAGLRIDDDRRKDRGS